MTLQVSPQTKRVFHLSLPIFAELLLQLLVGNMDQFMISHFGSAAVAAIGNGNQVMAGSVRNAARSSPWPLRSAPYSAFWWACSCF